MKRKFTEGTGSSIRDIELPVENGGEAIVLRGPFTDRIPTTATRAYFGNVMAYDPGDRRVGVYYGRMPHISADALRIKQRALALLFKTVEDGSDAGFLGRRPELKLPGYLGPTTHYNDVASAHVNAVHLRDQLSAYIIVKAIHLLRMSMLNGYKDWQEIGFLLRMQHVKGIIGELFGCPFDKALVKKMLAAMPELTSSDADTGTAMVFPLYIPFGANLYSDAMGIIPGDILGPDLDDMLEGVSTVAPELASFAAPTAWTGPSKHTQRWMQHQLGVLQTLATYWSNNFKYSSYAVMNTDSAGSVLQDFWVEQGLATTDRFNEKDFSEFLDSQVQTDLATFAKANWKFASKLAPLVRPARTGANTVSYGRSLAGVSPLSNGASLDLISTALDSYRSVVSVEEPSIDGTAYIQYYPIVPAWVSDGEEPPTNIQTGDSIHQFMDGMVGQLAPFVSADFESRVKSGLQQQLYTEMAQHWFSHHERFVSPGKVGEFVASSVADGNVYQIPELLTVARAFVPMYKESPVFDPYDPHCNGVFLLLNSSMVAATGPTTSWESIVNSAFTGIGARLTSGDRSAGYIPMFLGDGFGLPPLVHLSRADIFPWHAEYTNGIPALPARSILPDFSLRSNDMTTGELTPAIADLAITLSENQVDVESVVLPAVAAYTIAEMEIYDSADPMSSHAIQLLMPMTAPSVRRVITEHTDNGIYAFARNCFANLSDMSWAKSVTGKSGGGSGRGKDNALIQSFRGSKESKPERKDRRDGSYRGKSGKPWVSRERQDSFAPAKTDGVARPDEGVDSVKAEFAAIKPTPYGEEIGDRTTGPAGKKEQWKKKKR